MIAEDIKSTLERATGLARAKPADLVKLLRKRKATPFAFAGDGETPNNDRLPLILYKSPVRLSSGFDPAAIFEVLFEANAWRDSWRDGMYDYLHWHTTSHEVLGIAHGWLHAQFGGREGRSIRLRAGDVVILPAGVGHRRLAASDDLLVVGAYPAGSRYDEKCPNPGTYADAKHRIADVPVPPCDPVYGEHGPLIDIWTRRAKGVGRRIPLRAASYAGRQVS
jgi:uncharacterized protein YjlB